MDKFLKVFVDDLNVHNMIWEEHLEHLQYVLMKLREVNLKLNPRKYEFAKTSLVFIGHVVSRDGIQPNPRKAKAMNKFPVPIMGTNVHNFLGFTSHYKKYVKGYSHI